VPRQKLSTYRNRSYRIRPEILKTIIERYGNFESARMIAKDFGVTKQTILCHLKKAGIQKRKLGEARRAITERRYTNEGQKICSKCKRQKELSDFGKDQNAKNKLHRFCKICLVKKSRTARSKLTKADKRRYYEVQRRRIETPDGMLQQRETSKRHHARPAGKFIQWRSTAIRTGRGWTITKEEYLLLVKNPCTYCGGPLPTYGAGLDRLDNRRGYHADNVTPCCTICNLSRRDHFTPDEMRKFIGPAVKAIRQARAEAEVLSG
jgi:predicted transcriptional regulator